MGLLSSMSGSSFDPLVEKATSEENTSEDWALIMEICDRTVEGNGPKDCLRSIVRRLNSPIPGVVMQSLTLVDALVNNCGKKFHLEVCSRDFEVELRRLVNEKTTPHTKISDRTRQLIKKWAHEFRNDPQLNLIPSLYEKLKSEGYDFNPTDPTTKRNRISETVLKNPDAVTSNQEEADIAKAIELSLRESQKTTCVKSSSSTTNTTTSSTANTALYPSLNLTDSKSTPDVLFKVRALYDFEAAEDNELTFKAGEVILVQDNSDANWWKGSNHRGEGLFPANFVSMDLNAEPEPVFKNEKKVQFNDEVKVLDSEKGPASNVEPVPVVIDENKIDRLLHLLQEADPQSDKQDSDELLTLEEQCIAMMPLIDQEIELIDKQNAALESLSQKLNSSLNLYHELTNQSMMNQMGPMMMNNNVVYPNQIPVVGGYPQYQNAITTNGVAQYDHNSIPTSNATDPSYNPNVYYPNVVNSQPQPQYSQPTLQYGVGGSVPVAPQSSIISPQQSGLPVPQPSIPKEPYPTMYQSPTHQPQTAPYQTGTPSAIATTPVAYSAPPSQPPANYINSTGAQMNGSNITPQHTIPHNSMMIASTTVPNLL